MPQRASAARRADELNARPTTRCQTGRHQRLGLAARAWAGRVGMRDDALAAEGAADAIVARSVGTLWAAGTVGLLRVGGVEAAGAILEGEGRGGGSVYLFCLFVC